jgi:PAS domain S-box-containing protein
MRVLIVDDHEVVRRGVRSLLLSQNKYELCGEAVDGVEALEKARLLRPDVIVMDVSMPNLNGLEATRLLRNTLPECEIVILSQHESPEMARQALNAGARGYVAKRSMGKDLMAALEKVSRHEAFFDPTIWSTAQPTGHLDVQEILQRSAAFEQALRESEQLYRSTFELAAVGVAHVKPDGHWLRVNRKMCEILGYSEDELLTMTFQEVTHPEDLPADLLEVEKILNGAQDNFSMEKRYIRKDGSPVWVNLGVSVLRNSNGKVEHLISVVEDIHQRREADETRARLAAIVESSDDAIISKNLEGVILSWNAGATRIFEYTAEEAVGRSIMLIIPRERWDEEPHILGRMRRGERLEHFETVRMTKSGKKIDVSLTISPVRNSKGQVIGVSKIARDITARKQVEEALQESQRQLGLALDASKTAIFDWDVVGERGHWNPQMASIYQFQPEGACITAAEWNSLFHPGDVARLAAEAREMWNDKAQEKFNFEFRTVRPDGQTRWIVSQGQIVRDGEGKALRMIGTHSDITERKRVEQAVRESEERFRAILETTPECVKLVASDGTLLHMNSPGLKMIGADCAARVVGRSVYDLIAPEDRDRFREFNKRVCGGEKGALEFDVVGVAGIRRHMETHAAPLHNPDGSVVHLGVTRDVTARKQAEAALRQHRERFDLMAEASQVGFWFCDLPFEKLVWDKRVKDHFWLPADAEVTIGTFYERLHPDDRERTRQTIAECIERDAPYDIEFRTLAPDGSEKWIRAMGRAFYDAKGSPKSFDGLTLDVTDRKRAEDNYRKLAETLDAEVRARTRELEDRNADVLRQSEQVRELSLRLMRTQDEERRHIARDLHDSAGQTLTVLGISLAQLIHQAECVAPTLAKDGANIQELVQQLHREIRTTSYLLHPPLLDETGLRSALSWYVQGLVERGGLDIDLNVAEDLGRLPADMELAIFRLVQESLTNVHRHSGSKTAQIQISRDEYGVHVEVQDQGRGIEPGRLAEIQSRGAGLGLRGLRERLRQFQGEITIESNGPGTRVLAIIPFARRDGEEDADRAQAIAS